MPSFNQNHSAPTSTYSRPSVFSSDSVRAVAAQGTFIPRPVIGFSEIAASTLARSSFRYLASGLCSSLVGESDSARLTIGDWDWTDTDPTIHIATATSTAVGSSSLLPSGERPSRTTISNPSTAAIQNDRL